MCFQRGFDVADVLWQGVPGTGGRVTESSGPLAGGGYRELGGRGGSESTRGSAGVKEVREVGARL